MRARVCVNVRDRESATMCVFVCCEGLNGCKCGLGKPEPSWRLAETPNRQLSREHQFNERQLKHLRRKLANLNLREKTIIKHKFFFITSVISNGIFREINVAVLCHWFTVTQIFPVHWHVCLCLYFFHWQHYLVVCVFWTHMWSTCMFSMFQMPLKYGYLCSHVEKYVFEAP